MTSSKTRDGGIRVADRPDSEALPQDADKLLKTQDAGYIRVQAEMKRRKIEGLEGRLTFVAGGAKKKHIVFVQEEAEARGFDAAVFFDTHPDLVERGFNRPRLAQLADGGFGERSKMAKSREQSYKELEARMKREADLRRLEREGELQRARMGKSGTATKNKWATVRKR